MAMKAEWDPIKFQFDRHCLFCNFTTSDKVKMAKHFRVVCRSRRYICPASGCIKEYHGKEDLDEHIIENHFDNCLKYVSHDVYQCAKCPYKSVRQLTAYIHIRNRIDQSTFECYHCKDQHKFSTKLELIKHFKTHTEPTDYKCSGCDFNSTDKLEFDHHVVNNSQCQTTDLKYVTTCSTFEFASKFE